MRSIAVSLLRRRTWWNETLFIRSRSPLPRLHLNWSVFFQWRDNGTYKNNMVRLGVDAAGASITAGYAIYGMFEIAGTNNLYYNSVYVGGTGVASSSTTFGFVSNVTAGTRNYVDNIFWNARSNASGSAVNYAIALSGLERSHLQLQRSFCQWRWWLCGNGAWCHWLHFGKLAGGNGAGCQQHLRRTRCSLIRMEMPPRSTCT